MQYPLEILSFVLYFERYKYINVAKYRQEKYICTLAVDERKVEEIKEKYINDIKLDVQRTEKYEKNIKISSVFDNDILEYFKRIGLITFYDILQMCKSNSNLKDILTHHFDTFKNSLDDISIKIDIPHNFSSYNDFKSVHDAIKILVNEEKLTVDEMNTNKNKKKILNMAKHLGHHSRYVRSDKRIEYDSLLVDCNSAIITECGCVTSELYDNIRTSEVDKDDNIIITEIDDYKNVIVTNVDKDDNILCTESDKDGNMVVTSIDNVDNVVIKTFDKNRNIITNKSNQKHKYKLDKYEAGIMRKLIYLWNDKEYKQRFDFIVLRLYIVDIKYNKFNYNKTYRDRDEAEIGKLIENDIICFLVRKLEDKEIKNSLIVSDNIEKCKIENTIIITTNVSKDKLIQDNITVSNVVLITYNEGNLKFDSINSSSNLLLKDKTMMKEVKLSRDEIIKLNEKLYDKVMKQSAEKFENYWISKGKYIANNKWEDKNFDNIEAEFSVDEEILKLMEQLNLKK